MRHQQGESLTDLECAALDNGLARFYRGRLIPVMRGGSDDDGKQTGDLVVDTSLVDIKPADDGGRFFTKEQYDASVERHVRERLARERAKYADYDEIKARAVKFDELEEQNKTELQRANDRATDLERQNVEATQKVKDALLRSAVVAEAARRQVIDPDAALALIDRDSLTLDGEGRPTNIADAMESLLKAKPYLVGGGRAGNADLGARTNPSGPTQLTRADLKNMTPEQIAKADDEGRLEDLKRAT